MDVFSDLLSRARAQGAVFSLLERTRPWGLEFSGQRALTVHIMLTGSAWIEQGDDDPVELLARDVVLATAGRPYTIVSEPGAATVPIALARAEAAQQPSPAASATILCGAYVLSGSVGTSLLQSLPRFALIRAASQLPTHRAAIDLLAAEAESESDGQQAMLDRLLDVNLVSSLRTWWQAAENAPGWYRALDQPPIRAALEELHAHPDRRWTLPVLAQRAGLSRSGFAARFTRVVGVPPARYLADLRMSRAEDALIRTDQTLAVIAAQVGYGNEYAFATAFRRHAGMLPGRWRAARRNDPGPVPTGGEREHDSPAP